MSDTQRTTRTFTTAKNMVVETTLTDAEAIGLCRRLGTEGNKFAKELAAKYDASLRALASGRRSWGLSNDQWAWVHKLALGTPDDTTQIGDMKAVVDLFHIVRQHIRFPKIRLLVAPTPGGEPMPVALNYASGETAKHPNTINVTDGAPFGRNIWYGRIGITGIMTRSGKINKDEMELVVAILRRFAANPAAVAAEHGHLNSRCCFCDNPLNDERSVAMGYGPVCAEHYGLPWGERRFGNAELRVVVDNRQPFSNDPRVQAEYERLLAAGASPGMAEERAFDVLIQEQDRLDSERAAEAKARRDDDYIPF